MTLSTNLNNYAIRVASEAKSLRTLINGNAADNSALVTAAKGNLVAAINELHGLIGTAGAKINDAAPSASTVYSSSKTEAAVAAAVAGVLDTAPGALDTLNELAAALGDDPNFATTITNLLAGKAPTVHSHAMADLSDTTGVGIAVGTALTAAAARSAIGAGTSSLVIGTTAGTAADAASTTTALAGKAATSHVHTTAQVTGLDTALAGKAAASHTHAAADLPTATDLAAGVVELATTAEATTGTDATRAVTPAGLKAVADTKAASSHVHTTAQVTGLDTALAGKAATTHAHAAADVTSGVLAAARLPSATATALGIVELATTVEATAGTDTTRAVTPQGLKTVADTKANAADVGDTEIDLVAAFNAALV